MKDDEKIKNNKHLFKFGIILAGIVVILIIFEAVNFFVTGNVISGIQNKDIQEVKLSVQGSNYVLEPSTLKLGIPVRMKADMSKVVGCSNSIVISGFNVKKTVTTSDNIIEFTPDKSGTFNIACSMNMYQGTFSVLDSEGKKAEYIEPVSTGGHSCGAGCGCGG